MVLKSTVCTVSVCRKCIHSSAKDKVTSENVLEGFVHSDAPALRYIMHKETLLVFSSPLCLHEAEVQHHRQRESTAV